MAYQPEQREMIIRTIAHLEHILPGQAPIKDFVHHNTLHGYQHLHFTDAVSAAERHSGAKGFLPERRYREFFQQGRINKSDIEKVLLNDPNLHSLDHLFTVDKREYRRKEIYINALIHPFEPLTGCQLGWMIEESQSLNRFQADVSDISRVTLLESAKRSEEGAITDLWQAVLERLGLEHFVLHPEALMDLSPELAESILDNQSNESYAEASSMDEPLIHIRTRKESHRQFEQLQHRVGREITLGEMLKSLTGIDILEEIRPNLVRQIANFIDQGLASWHNSARPQGFFQSWRKSAAEDLVWIFTDLPEWRDELEILPEDPIDTILVELQRMGIDNELWGSYLERLALELPGWSGMFLWRNQHPGYESSEELPVEMIDYLAVRLVLERLYAQRVCRQHWQIEANLDLLRWYFHRRRSEFLVRNQLFNKRLPEYLASRAHPLLENIPVSSEHYGDWKTMADQIWTWLQSPAAERPGGHSVYRSGWFLFRLAQHLGLSGDQIRQIDAEGIEAIITTFESLTEEVRGYIWLRAYENHYRDQLFNAILYNHAKGRWPDRKNRPASQLVFCMDDREEGFRRHLEEIAPEVETLGAAAHFGVPHNWHGLGDSSVTALTPVVYVPIHKVTEQPKPGEGAQSAQFIRRNQQQQGLQDTLIQMTRSGALVSIPVILAMAPAALGLLAGKIFAPLLTNRLIGRLKESLSGKMPTTRIQFTAEQKIEATPAENQDGFTDSEQADRLEMFLQNLGLISGFAPLIVIMGHGSNSENNPHLAAYDCGACSGRHSGPNARLFAGMANRTEVRLILSERGINIPDDCWFIGGEHNTCNEAVTWYDTDLIPENLHTHFSTLNDQINTTIGLHAQERCRRLASAPANPTPEKAHHHVAARAKDFSQARPELGHATNAAAVIGRRSMTQGTFFDRRVFLISYDASTDSDGSVLERLLLANGPVGAGINLEYYFSTVDNNHYGSGSKITHNITGLFGVMDGTTSDLKTGLPKQMIEIHEAMRLQVMVEAKITTLTEIYTRQPPLQELIGKGWLLLAAKDPETATIHIFDPDQGWQLWQEIQTDLPEVATSHSWFTGKSEPLTPAYINQECRHA